MVLFFSRRICTLVICSLVLISLNQRSDVVARIAEPDTISVEVVFMEPLPDTEKDAGDLTKVLQSKSGRAQSNYRPVTDAKALAQYRTWLDNDAAEMALDLVRGAWQVMAARDGEIGATQQYHVALIPRGNFASSGFVLHTADGVVDHSGTAFIKLDPSPKSFGDTFLHETGHVALSIISNGGGVPTEQMSSIPHTTAALTDRGTAFNEGFAIHLETLAGHFLLDQAEIQRVYQFDQFNLGSDNWRQSEFFRHAIDLRSYAQSRARYEQVRRNNYAFASAFTKPDYLRVQLDPARDFAKLRTANQLLQSEGFNASFFYAFMMADFDKSAEVANSDNGVNGARRVEMLNVLAEMFATGELNSQTPYLLTFTETFMKLYPERATQMVALLNDLSHGVFADSAAVGLWDKAYRAALSLDIANFPPPELVAQRTAWVEELVADSKMLFSQIGPQLGCMVRGPTVFLVAFGQKLPLAFDVNTVQEGIMRLVPNITEDEIGRWLTERLTAPFADVENFKARMGAESAFLTGMQF